MFLEPKVSFSVETPSYVCPLSLWLTENFGLRTTVEKMIRRAIYIIRTAKKSFHVMYFPIFSKRYLTKEHRAYDKYENIPFSEAVRAYSRNGKHHQKNAPPALEKDIKAPQVKRTARKSNAYGKKNKSVKDFYYSRAAKTVIHKSYLLYLFEYFSKKKRLLLFIIMRETSKTTRKITISRQII